MASIVTMAPVNSKTANNLGIAVISLDFSSTTSWPRNKRFSAAQALTICRGFLPLARSSVARAVLPSMATNWPSVLSCKASTHFRKQATKASPSTAANTRVKVSWQGVPSGNDKYFSSQARLLLPNFSMATQSLAPLTTAHSAMKMMSGRLYRLGRSRRGSSKAANGANSVGTRDSGMAILLRETGESRRIIRSPLVPDYCTANNVQAFRCVCPGYLWDLETRLYFLG